MRETAKAAVAVVLLSSIWSGVCVPAPTADLPALAEGKRIAFEPTRGNCLACHQIADGESAGDVGPPLIAMRARFPDKSELWALLWDPTDSNPLSRMPPFGRFKILTEAEIDKVVEYLYTL